MTTEPNNFKSSYGPTALITGASDGIGKAMAEDIASRGLNLVLVARRKGRLDDLATELSEKHGIEAAAIAADLGTEEGVRQALNAFDSHEVGLMVACAGFGTAGPFLENAVDDELNMIDVNCRALAALTHRAGQSMRDRGKGGIILMSSIVAFQGVRNSANYAATKAYVQSLAEGFAAELAPHGIDVLASAPGPVASEFAARADMQMDGAAAPKTVARGTLNALGRRVTVRPGFQSRFLGHSLGTLPRWARSRILGKIMTGMTKHRNA